ncbi:Nephrin [Penaeus vannamei]|uniref:Nephrin n=1 Tax=Penaeus vannamei TaxID=6689 RepID=A0A423SI43_PENVA|nr:Nephrin [Penaeus vannamei]
MRGPVRGSQQYFFVIPPCREWINFARLRFLDVVASARGGRESVLTAAEVEREEPARPPARTRGRHPTILVPGAPPRPRGLAHDAGGSVVLSVLHAPSVPAISGYKTGEVLVAGDERTLTCEVVGGNPRPRVAWYRHGRPLNTVHKPTKRRVSGPEHRKERVVTVKQDVTATRLEDGAVYECRATTAILPDPISATVTLTVHYSPTHVNLSGPEVVRPGQHFSLTCTTSPANPPAYPQHISCSSIHFPPRAPSPLLPPPFFSFCYAFSFFLCSYFASSSPSFPSSYSIFSSLSIPS